MISEKNSTILFYTVALLIVLSTLPAAFPNVTISLDHFLASHHLFYYATQHHFIFGSDVIDNVGPFGYLHYFYTYVGDPIWQKLLWFFTLACFFAYYATCLLVDMEHGIERCLFLLILLVFPLQLDAPWFLYEVMPREAILFSALFFLRGKASNHQIHHLLLNGVFYAFLTLEKGSNIYFISTLLAILSLYWIIHRQWRYMVAIFTSFCLSVLGFWLILGHPVSKLGTYFLSLQQYVDAYQNIFSEPISKKLLYFALAYLIAGFVLIFTRATLSFYAMTRAHHPFNERLIEVFRGLMVAFTLMVSWKHGISRGAFSFNTYLYCIPALFAYLIFYPIDGIPLSYFQPKVSVRQIVSLRILIFMLFLTAISINLVQSGYEGFFLKEIPGKISRLYHAHPLARVNALQLEYAAFCRQHRLPASLQKELKQSTIDEFGNSPEIILANQLNYKPRPTPIFFIVANQALNQKNGSFYRNKQSAPDYVLLPDYGFKSTDSLAYLSLLLNYHATRPVEDWILLKKNAAWLNYDFSPDDSKKIKLGDWIDLNDNHLFTWSQVVLKPSLLGQLKSTLYRATLVQLQIETIRGARQTYNLSLGELNSGFLINPLIPNKQHLKVKAYLHEAPWDLVKRFRIVPIERKEQRFFKNTLLVTLSHIQPLTAKRPLTIASVNAPLQTTPFLKIQPVNLPLDVVENHSEDVTLENFGNFEQLGHAKWRWLEGPSSRVSFVTHQGRAHLQLQLNNLLAIPNQTISIFMNQHLIYQQDLAGKREHHLTLQLNLVEGMNILTMKYHDWNHHQDGLYAPNDTRRLALQCLRFKITP